MALTDYPRPVISSDGTKGLLLLAYEGSQKLTSRQAVGHYFTVRLQPNARESRLSVLFSREVLHSISNPEPLGLPRFDNPELAAQLFSEAAVGEYLNGGDRPDFTPSGTAAFEIECFSNQFNDWLHRTRATDHAIGSYLERKLLWAWRFDELVARFEFADLVRFHAPMSALHKVALLGDGRDWATIHQGPNHIHLRPHPELIRRLTKAASDPLAASPGTSVQTPTPQWALMHPDIALLARSRFEAGHYPDAVQAALKHVNTSVKDLYMAAGKSEDDGASVMHRAFTGDNPVIKLTPLETESDRSVQEGFRFLFAGAIMGIRNPTAHANVAMSPNTAVHSLWLASLLMIALDARVGSSADL